jgi:hypothetical protein
VSRRKNNAELTGRGGENGKKHTNIHMSDQYYGEFLAGQRR